MVIINDSPVAKAGPNQYVGLKQVVTFDGSGSFDPDGSIAIYSWDFGDDSKATGVQVRHLYKKSGQYKVTLHVSDQTGLKNNWATDSLFVSVNETPVAQISEFLSLICVGESIHLSGQESFDPDGSIKKYMWDFGDGSSGKGMEVEHAYNVPGSYHVTLTVDDGSKALNSTAEATVNVNINHAPVAEAGPNRHICPGEKITFDGSESWDRDGVVKEYIWSLGDGMTKEGKQVVHIYDKPGIYQVVLTIRDDSGSHCAMGQDTMTVEVNTPPVAVAGQDMKAFYGGAYDAVLFDGTQSFDPDGKPLTYYWDFGDGSVGIGPIVSHLYNRPGTYAVQLRVSDGTNTKCKDIFDDLKVIVKARNSAN
jgi:PKD repeat protein